MQSCGILGYNKTVLSEMELEINFEKHRADTNWKPIYLTWDVERLR